MMNLLWRTHLCATFGRYQTKRRMQNKPEISIEPHAASQSGKWLTVQRKDTSVKFCVKGLLCYNYAKDDVPSRLYVADMRADSQRWKARLLTEASFHERHRQS